MLGKWLQQLIIAGLWRGPLDNDPLPPLPLSGGGLTHSHGHLSADFTRLIGNRVLLLAELFRC
jgi:hypothetical protein